MKLCCWALGPGMGASWRARGIAPCVAKPRSPTSWGTGRSRLVRRGWEARHLMLVGLVLGTWGILSPSWLPLMAGILLSLLINTATYSPAYAAGPWYVAPGGNDDNDCLSPATPCATIKGAIGKASPGDTVKVTAQRDQEGLTVIYRWWSCATVKPTGQVDCRGRIVSERIGVQVHSYRGHRRLAHAMNHQNKRRKA